MSVQTGLASKSWNSSSVPPKREIRQRVLSSASCASLFIGPESDHWQCLSVTHSLTNSLTDCRLVNLIDVTLVCEDGNSKLVEVVTVVDVDAEDNVGNSLLQIWELTFGSKAKLLFRLWPQGLVKILKLRFRQDFEAGFCSAFCCWCFVEVMKLNLGRDSEAKFGQDFEF